MTGAGGELLAGRYRLDERVGVGAMGEVWRARDLTLRRDVALKRVRLDGHVDTAARDRFRREAVAMAGVSHPNVVSVYDSGTDVVEGREIAYLVMELLDGPSCSDLIRSSRVLDFDEIERIGAGVARGLAAAHAAGVVHRDIKPGNVVVGAGLPKIVDFGIARLEQESTSTLTAPQTTIGTAAYMSPEQAMGKHIGPASDVYSLGALLVALATGSPPFGASNALALMRAHIDDAPPLLSELRPGVPAPLTELVGRMLAKDPADRPSAAEVAELLGGDDAPLVLEPVAATAPIAPVAAGAGAAAATAAGTEPAARLPDSLRTTAEVTSVGARPSSGGRVLAWIGGLLVAGALAVLGWNLFGGNGEGDTATPPAGPTATTSRPTATPTEHLVAPTPSVTGAPMGSPTASPASPTGSPTGSSTGSPTGPATLDDAVAEADTVIRGITGPEARDDLVREWQGASNGLQGANASEHLRDVIDKAEDLADDGDITAEELTAVRSAVGQVIALLP